MNLYFDGMHLHVSWSCMLLCRLWWLTSYDKFLCLSCLWITIKIQCICHSSLSTYVCVYVHVCMYMYNATTTLLYNTMCTSLDIQT